MMAAVYATESAPFGHGSGTISREDRTFELHRLRCPRSASNLRMRQCRCFGRVCPQVDSYENSLALGWKMKSPACIAEMKITMRPQALWPINGACRRGLPGKNIESS